MNKDEVIDAVEDGYEQFLESIEGLSHEAMVEPGVVDDWSIKEMISHISQWKAELIRMLWQAGQNQDPVWNPMGIGIDERNNRFRQETKGRTIEQAIADYNGVSRQLIKQLESMKEKDFGNPQRFSWLKGEPLEEWVAGNSYDHEAEHIEQIKAWREKCK